MKPASTKSRSVKSRALAGNGQPCVPIRVGSLTNGRYSVRLNELGSGASMYRGTAVTRSMPDATCDADGFYIYLRDLDDDFTWSAGYQPTRVTADRYDFQYNGGVAEIVRVDRDIECRLSICVSPQLDLEIRQGQLTNLGQMRRRIELTSYLEWVLGSRDFDAAHPAFSKLFVETSYCRERNAILARRRPRQADEPGLIGFHAVVGEVAAVLVGQVRFETNRARFIGRGRTVRNPQALETGGRLSGECGPVLDPIAALQVGLGLEPGETKSIAFVLGVGHDRESIGDLLEAICNLAAVGRVFEQAATEDSKSLASRGVQFETNGDVNGERIIIHSPHRDAPPRAPWNGSAPIDELKFRPGDLQSSDERRGSCDPPEPLEFDNGYGGFTADGREYVIRVQPDGTGGQRRPPMPWVNVIANEQAGCLITESGAGYTWAGNSRLNRLTAWHNDPVSDPHSEAIWIRDEDGGTFWSPMPGPTPAAAGYLVRHGFGYTVFEHESHGLSQETTVFMARDEPVKLTRLRIENRSGRPRRLSLFSYAHWALGGLISETVGQVATAYDAQSRVIWATNPHREHYGRHVAFSAVRFDGSETHPAAFTCDRAMFLGRLADMHAPAAIAGGDELDGQDGAVVDPCACWHLSIEIPPGGTFECTHLLGEATDRQAALVMLRNYDNRQQIQQALDQAVEFWRELVSAIEIETPDGEIDLMVNGWLLYQNLSCRMWGRSAYYQPGGAFGFRDQLQDAAAFVYHRPEITRTQILRHAAQQFVEGDVLHWWHPDTRYGVRTRFSDDLLWLPLIAAEYVQKTGDAAVLNEELPFIEAPPLAEGQQEAYLRPTLAGERATLYEHCCRALDRGLTRGPNGLPLIGCGDWNDGFSRIGRLGRGESVWLGFFIDHILERMLPICAERGDADRIEKYRSYRSRLREALNSTGWDGQWYRRAYYDNGEPLGSSSGEECQIDALAQAWAVLSGVAPPDRADMAMRALEQRLVDEHAGIIRLLTPPFDRTPNDPGYIKGYLPGIRENGGQYTHGVLWVVRALAEMGRGTRAADLLRMLTPVWHANSRERADVYKTEPYVVAADIYGASPHVGRGGWTWYTGSAGWMYRVAVESIFGLTTEQGQTLVINPCISSAWPSCRITYRLPDGRTRYEITIENPSGKERGVKEAFVDGTPAEVVDGAARVQLLHDGKSHQVAVRL